MIGRTVKYTIAIFLYPQWRLPLPLSFKKLFSVFRCTFLLVWLIALTGQAKAQKIKAIELRLVSRDLSRETADPLNIYIENDSQVLASKQQYFEWKTSFPPIIKMQLSQGISLEKFESCKLKVLLKKGREAYKFDCVINVFVEGQKKPIKRRVNDLNFPGSVFPSKQQDSIIYPLAVKL